MVNDPILTNDARMIVRDFVKVEPGESVTVLTDAQRRHEAHAIHQAVQDAGGDGVLIDLRYQVASLLLGDRFWVDPPASVVAAVQNSTVTIVVLDETYGFRFDHKVRDLFRTGPGCSIYKVDLGMGSWRLTRADVELVERTSDEVLRAFGGADEVRVTSPAGTDVVLSIRGRECLPVLALPERGHPYAIPIPLWGEFNWAPVETTVNGTIVIDGITEATSQLHVVSEPVVWTVVEGRVVEVAGGQDAADFRELFKIDDGASLIGELGIGGNPRAVFGTETEKARLGTAHFGLGQNDEYPGGKIRSAVHVDGVVRNARVEVDGKLVIADGGLTTSVADSVGTQR
jgi:leucyl aminopeptidase (aminopeptidase T)